MASAVHIPESAVIDVNPLLDMAKEGAVTIERSGESFQLIRQPIGRTAAEALAMMKDRPSANVTLDDEWSKDMQAIYDENRRNDRDPWQE